MSYLLAIDEPQRLALLALLREAVAAKLPAIQSRQAFEHPLDLWEAMLADLPAQEASAPGCVHGFCL